MNLSYKMFDVTPLAFGYGSIPVFWLLAFGLSLAVSEVMQRIAPLRKYVV